MDLDAFRQRLDVIDSQMVSLLAERAQVILQVAEFKRQHDLPIYIPERETAIVERLRTLNAGPLSGDALERIYRTILEEMRKLEGEHCVY